MRVGIVGADARKWPDQKRGEEAVAALVKNLKTEYPTALTIVSGHCPVGEEKYFCLNCMRWNQWPHPNHRNVKGHFLGGVDTWAEIYASKYHARLKTWPAEFHGWPDMRVFEPQGCKGITHYYNGDPTIFPHVHFGFKSRNAMIASDVELLYVLSPMGDDRKLVWNGGLWTGNYAEHIGRRVIRMEVK